MLATKTKITDLCRILIDEQLVKDRIAAKLRLGYADNCASLIPSQTLNQNSASLFARRTIGPRVSIKALYV